MNQATTKKRLLPIIGIGILIIVLGVLAYFLRAGIPLKVSVITPPGYPASFAPSQADYAVTPNSTLDVPLTVTLTSSGQLPNPKLESVKFTLEVPSYLSNMTYTPPNGAPYTKNQVNGKWLLFVYSLNIEQANTAVSLGTLRFNVGDIPAGTTGAVNLNYTSGTIQLSELTGRDANNSPVTVPLITTPSALFFNVHRVTTQQYAVQGRVNIGDPTPVTCESMEDPCHGTVTPADQMVDHGSSASVVVTSETGWHLQSLVDNGGTINLSGSSYLSNIETNAAGQQFSFTYTIPNVTVEHTIVATFEQDTGVHIDSITPVQGPIGTQITLIGKGFDPIGNFIKVTIPKEGGEITAVMAQNVPSTDIGNGQRRMQFPVPENLLPGCVLTAPNHSCPTVAVIPTEPRLHHVWVVTGPTNDPAYIHQESDNSVDFTVTTSTQNKCADENNDGQYDACNATGTGPNCSSPNQCTSSPTPYKCNYLGQCVIGGVGASCSGANDTATCTMTRAELMQEYYNAAKNSPINLPDSTCTADGVNIFTDVPLTHPNSLAIRSVCQAGVMMGACAGQNGQFLPDQNAQRSFLGSGLNYMTNHLFTPLTYNTALFGDVNNQHWGFYVLNLFFRKYFGNDILGYQKNIMSGGCDQTSSGTALPNFCPGGVVGPDLAEQMLKRMINWPDDTSLVKITSHTNNQTVSTANITLAGNVAEYEGGNIKPKMPHVKDVLVRTNCGNWQAATLTGTNWTRSVTLTNGANNLYVLVRGDENNSGGSPTPFVIQPIRINLSATNAQYCRDTDDDGEFDACGGTVVNNYRCDAGAEDPYDCGNIDPNPTCSDENSDGVYDTCKVNGGGPFCTTNEQCYTDPPADPGCNDLNQCVIGGTSGTCANVGGTCSVVEHTRCKDTSVPADGINDICAQSGTANDALCAPDDGGTCTTTARCNPVTHQCATGGASNTPCTLGDNTPCGGGTVSRCEDTDGDGLYEQCSANGDGPECTSDAYCTTTWRGCNNQSCVAGGAGSACTQNSQCTTTGDLIPQNVRAYGNAESCMVVVMWDPVEDPATGRTDTVGYNIYKAAGNATSCANSTLIGTVVGQTAFFYKEEVPGTYKYCVSSLTGPNNANESGKGGPSNAVTVGTCPSGTVNVDASLLILPYNTTMDLPLHIDNATAGIPQWTVTSYDEHGSQTNVARVVVTPTSGTDVYISPGAQATTGGVAYVKVAVGNAYDIVVVIVWPRGDTDGDFIVGPVDQNNVKNGWNY